MEPRRLFGWGSTDQDRVYLLTNHTHRPHNAGLGEAESLVLGATQASPSASGNCHPDSASAATAEEQPVPVGQLGARANQEAGEFGRVEQPLAHRVIALHVGIFHRNVHPILSARVSHVIPSVACPLSDLSTVCTPVVKLSFSHRRGKHAFRRRFRRTPLAQFAGSLSLKSSRPVELRTWWCWWV